MELSEVESIERLPSQQLPYRSSQTSSVASSKPNLVAYDTQTVSVPVSVCVAVMFGYIMFGSMIFGLWEKWITGRRLVLLYIAQQGLGSGREDLQGAHRDLVRRVLLVPHFGMALVAMSFNFMQEQVIHYFACIKRVLKCICRCKR